jgi:hypothetical protein
MSKKLLIFLLLLNIFFKINCGNALMNIKNSFNQSKTFEINWLTFSKFSKFQEKETEFFLSFVKNENENKPKKLNENIQIQSFNKTVIINKLYFLIILFYFFIFFL